MNCPDLDVQGQLTRQQAHSTTKASIMIESRLLKREVLSSVQAKRVKECDCNHSAIKEMLFDCSKY